MEQEEEVKEEDVEYTKEHGSGDDDVGGNR